MSAGMAEVISAHKYEFLPLVCGCGVVCGADEDELTYAAHLAEELAKAGYGNAAEAWNEGAIVGWRQSGEGFNSEYPDESTGECSVDLSANPYREAPHGVD